VATCMRNGEDVGAAMGVVCGISEEKKAVVSTAGGAGIRDQAQARRQGAARGAKAGTGLSLAVSPLRPSGCIGGSIEQPERK